jgi:RNA polymerase sigma-70 factor (ECF subfamily)
MTRRSRPEKGTKEIDIRCPLLFNGSSGQRWPEQIKTRKVKRRFRLREKHFCALAAAARRGDLSALGILLGGFQPYLHLVADRKLGADLKPKCAPSDLVQQTFLEAQRAFEHFQGSRPEELRAWLERILLNNLGDAARRFRDVAKRRVGCEVSLANCSAKNGTLLDASTPSKAAVAEEEQESLRQALQRLSEDYRRVIMLRNLERRTFEDIANEFGRSTGAVKKLWSRAILQLKAQMTQNGRP